MSTNVETEYLIDELSKLPPMVLHTAYLYGYHLVNYGVDITQAWVTAVQQSYMIDQVKAKTRHDTIEEVLNSRHGHWIYITDTHGKCSKCEKVVPLGKFCNNCGTMMEERNED